MYPSATDSLRPVHLFAKLCGLHPGEPTDQSTMHYYIVFCSLMAALPVKNFVEYMTILPALYNDIVLFTNALHVTCTRAMHIIFLYVPLTKTKLYKKIFKKLCRAEKLIYSLNMKQEEVPDQRWQYFFIFVIAFTHVSLFSMFYLQGRISLEITCVALVDFLRFNSYMLQINSLLYAILSKFALINWHLEYVNNKAPAYLTPLKAKELINRKIHAKGVEEKFVDFGLSTRTVSATKIRTINQIHFLLSSCCSRVRDYFSVQNCVSIVQSALHTMHFSVAIFDVKSIEGMPLDIYVAVVTYNYIWWIFVVAKLCHLIKTEAKNSALLVHALLDEEQPDDVVRELEAFSKQLMSRKIVFSAAGFFDIDLKMITSMVGIVLPVTLFLVQYNNAQRKRLP